MTSILWAIRQRRAWLIYIGTDLDKGFEFFIFDIHVFYWIQERYAIRKSPMHFLHALPESLSGRLRTNIFGHEYSNVADTLYSRQQHGNDQRHPLLS